MALKEGRREKLEKEKREKSERKEQGTRRGNSKKREGEKEGKDQVTLRLSFFIVSSIGRVTKWRGHSTQQ